MIKIRRFFIIILLSVFFIVPSFANEESPATLNPEEIYKDQLQMSGADKLQDALPNETKQSMENIGISEIDINNFQDITPEKIFGEIFKIAKKNSPAVMRSIAIVLAIILLSALINSIKLSVKDRPLSGIIEIISTLCICFAVIHPIVNSINKTGSIIKGASRFLLCYIPVITGIMVASGNAVNAAWYSMMMFSAGEIMRLIAS